MEGAGRGQRWMKKEAPQTKNETTGGGKEKKTNQKASGTVGGLYSSMLNLNK